MAALVTLSTTTLSNAVLLTDQVLTLASLSGVTVGSALFSDGEAFRVTSLPASGTTVQVLRGQGGSQSTAHVTGLTVYIGTPDQFYTFNPQGQPPAQVLVTPWINTVTGQIWQVSGNTWLEVGGAGGGNVTGPASAVDGHLAVFSGTTGTLIKDGGVAGGGITQLTGGVTAGPGSGSQAATVVTNANLTGPITSVGNATTITAASVTNAMLAGSITAAKLVGTDIGVIGTLTVPLLFTDNTLDIGASAATRPRTIYPGTSIVTPNGGAGTITNGYRSFKADGVTAVSVLAYNSANNLYLDPGNGSAGFVVIGGSGVTTGILQHNNSTFWFESQDVSQDLNALTLNTTNDLHVGNATRAGSSQMNDLFLDVQTGKTVHLAVNAVDQATLTGSGLTSKVVSLTDTNNLPFLKPLAIASAVDWLTVTNGATGNPARVAIGAAGSDTNIGVGVILKGSARFDVNGVGVFDVDQGGACRGATFADQGGSCSLSASHMQIASGSDFVWTSGAQYYSGSVDTGLFRNAAGVVEINNGTHGTFRDLIARNITSVGGAQFLTTNTALTNSAAANTATLTNAPTAGNPTKWIGINDNGTVRQIPAW